jgi:hypothetical protein
VKTLKSKRYLLGPCRYLNPRRAELFTHRVVSGIGYETARVLASAGADSVVLACRNLDLGGAAAEKIRSQLPSEVTVNVKAMQCDLSSLQSVRQFAKDYNAQKRPLHVLGALPCYAATCYPLLLVTHSDNHF